MTGVVSFLREFEPPAEAGAEGSARSKEQAYQAGVAEGRALAQAEAKAEMAQALGEMGQAFMLSAAARQEMLDGMRVDASVAIATVVRAICPRLAERGLYDAVHQVLSDAVSASQGPIVVAAAPGTARALCERLRAETGIAFEITERADLSASHVEIDWTGGGAEIDVGAVASRIIDLADGLAGTSHTENEGTEA